MTVTNSRVGRTYPSFSQITPAETSIINMLVEDFVNHTRQTIQTWRQGIESADHPSTPYTYILQDLFEYLHTDGHLQSQMKIRKGAVLGKRFYVRDSKTGKENPDKTKLLEKKWFFSLVSELLDSLFYGYTVLQVPDLAALVNPHPFILPYEHIPRRKFIPQKNMVLIDEGGIAGYSILDPAFNNTIICLKSQDRLGLLNYVVTDLIWKKNARQAWATFSDKFGIPLVKVTTNKTNKADIDRIEAMAKMMGQAARAVLPNGTTMDIVDSATKGDPHEIFNKQVEVANDEISKVILGGTMISQNGSSRSQGEVMERTLDNKITAMDLKEIQFTINDQLMPILIAAGLPFDKTDEFAYDETENLSLTQLWSITQGVMADFDVDEQWVMDKFNIKITGKKQAAAPPQLQEPPPEDVQPADPKKPKPIPKNPKKGNPKASAFFD